MSKGVVPFNCVGVIRLCGCGLGTFGKNKECC